jgi:exopolyphosphatase/guanosine-5'-triphosphate,3'-diphosphate pyrophosphatase
MDKYALFEIGTTHMRLTLATGEMGKYFHTYKTLSEYVHINEHIAVDGLIKSSKIYECITIIKMYKKICDAEGVKNFFAVAAQNLTVAKNYKSFVDELGSSIGQEFKTLSTENERDMIYYAVSNTIDVGKGCIVNTSSFSTRIIYYNRRMIIADITIPYGSVSLFEKAENDTATAMDILRAELEKNAQFLKTLDPETELVGTSNIFLAYGRIARKMKKYPVDIEHNYVSDIETFEMVFDFIKNLDMEKRQKLKGVSSHSAKTILGEMCIVDAILKFSGLKSIVVANSYRNSGILFNELVPTVQEKPISDLLGYSFEVINALAKQDGEQSRRHYDLAIMLFKQIRVLHKLPRYYAKPLRIASNMYNISDLCSDKYHAILSAPICGASHKEIVLAAFAASFKKFEDFNLAEWVKFKDIMTDEDLEAVRKISMILAMAEAFDIRGAEIIKDISCDLLGDSVIIKLITTTDQRVEKVDAAAADVEIFYAKKYANEFHKIFKRSIELL